MYIKIEKHLIEEGITIVLGETFDRLYSICEVEYVPSYHYIEVNEDYNDFFQRVHEGYFGEILSIKQLNETTMYKEILSDEEIADCRSLGELKRQYTVVQLKKDIEALTKLFGEV